MAAEESYLMGMVATPVGLADGGLAEDDFTSEEQPLGVINAAFRVIESHVSEGKIQDE